MVYFFLYMALIFGGTTRADEQQPLEAKPKILRTGYTSGTYNKLSWGDDQRLEIVIGGNKKSFWCWQGCEKLSNLKGKPKIVVFWREVESFIPEAGEKVKRTETTQVFLAKEVKACSMYKKLPHLSKGCEGEACGFLQYKKAVKSVSVYAEPDTESKKIGTLNRCQKIDSFETYSKLNEYGFAEVIKPNEQLKKIGVKKGDLITVVRYLGEGYLAACVGKIKIDAVDSKNDPYGKQASVKVLQYNKSDVWVKLKLQSGVSGYVPDKSNFYMGYATYYPEYFCPEDHPCGKDFLEKLKLIESKLTESFNKYCRIRKGCHSSDPSIECQLSKDVWKDISPLIPKNIQCANFGVSKTACDKEWGGSFTCTCPNKKQRGYYYSYSCKKGNGEGDCRMDSPFKL